MGILGDIGRVIVGGVVGGPIGAIAVIAVTHGEDVFEATIDATRQLVKIGTDVYRAIPPEAFLLTGFPLHGLLKHEFEDEIVWIGQVGANIAIYTVLTWPALGPVGASLAIAEGAVPLYITGKSLVGALDHRFLNDQEWEMAEYIFRGSLLERDEIVLTNLGGEKGAAFVYPSTTGSVFVNLGNSYVHNATIPNGPLLFHELTHVWQVKARALSEIFLYDARVQLTQDDPYAFIPGKQFREYNIEQQASIVEAWTLGATRKAPLPLEFDDGARGKLSIGSPVFRYINGNIWRGRRNSRTREGRSTRRLLREGGHRTFRQMHSRPPAIWW